MQNNHLMTDREMLGLTTRILDAPEFRVFELAYQEWYGKPGTDRDLDPVFFDYAIKGELPCWVRAYSRSTLQLCEEAGMDLPVTHSGHKLTLAVSQAEMLLALLGLGAVCLLWIAKLV